VEILVPDIQFEVCALPSLMCASFAVGDHAVLALEPFCAFDTVELAQTWKIFSGFAALMLFEVLR
jgi:hypothetical protein